jgi:hypothetical protein
MKKAIYHLHIPRTSGIFISKHVYEYSKENNKNFFARNHSTKVILEDFKKQDYITGHYGLTPIPYSQKTFAILRNPTERSFSYMKYIWQGFYSYMNIDEAFMFFLTDKKIQEAISNQQSKFLTSELNVEEYNKNIHDINKHVISGWSLINKEIDKNSVIKSIKDNKIKILFFEDKDLYKKVFNIFELNNIENINFYEKKNSSIPVDLEIYQKYYDKIYEINKIDIDVYNFLKEREVDVKF